MFLAKSSSASRVRKTLGRSLRPVFERRFLSTWRGLRIEVRYWDGRRVGFGSGRCRAEVDIRCPSVLAEMLINASTGFGNAYVDGRLRVGGDLSGLLQAAYENDSLREIPGVSRLFHWLRYPVRQLLRIRNVANARFHYDVGNDFFRTWLDPSMTYSCAYFRDPYDDLSRAQQQKLDLICRKLSLRPGLRLLDVGCGWGSLLFHAIENYGVRGVGVTPSREQAAWLHAEADRRGISSDLTLHVDDWRAVDGVYDRVVSVGMFEHVGKAYGSTFLRRWRRWLKPGGLSVLHTIGSMDSCPPDPWIEKNIFPGGYLPSLAEIATHASHAGLMIADVENLWRHYAMTLQAWIANFADARPSLETTIDQRTLRAWWLYLNASQAAFATGRLQLWQIVVARDKKAPLALTREPWLQVGQPADAAMTPALQEASLVH